MILQGGAKPAISSIINAILLTALAVGLPAVQWAIFGWLQFFSALIAFYVLGRFGRYTGLRILGCALVLGLIGSLIFSGFDLFVFSLTMMAAGYAIYRSAELGDGPVVSGFKGCLVLGACWAGFFVFNSLGAEQSTYSQLISTFTQGIDESLKYYHENSGISTDSLVVLEETLLRMKDVVPVIMPAILGSMILTFVWLTMVIGNRFLIKLHGGGVWPSYSLWQFPEKLIWVGIGLGLLCLVPLSPIRETGINGLILMGLLYSFQGMAITVFFMGKWHVPILFRSFIYAMIVLQSFGTIMLLVVGIADLWFDFRKLKLQLKTQ